MHASQPSDERRLESHPTDLVWMMLPPALAFSTTAYNPLGGDIWWVLISGRQMVDDGRLLTSYPFTFAPQTAQFIDAQWLGQIGYYLVYALLGLPGVALLTTLLATATIAILLQVAARGCQNLPIASLCTAVGLMVATSNFQSRTQTMAFLLFMVTFWTLLRAPRRATTVVILAATVALWANLHGSFFLAPLLSAVFLAGHLVDSALVGHHARMPRVGGTQSYSSPAAAGEGGGEGNSMPGTRMILPWHRVRPHLTSPIAMGEESSRGELPPYFRRHVLDLHTSEVSKEVTFLVICIGAQLTATLATPFGWDLFDYVRRISSDPTIRSVVTEWRPTGLDTPTGLLFFTSVVATVGSIALSRRRPSITNLILLGIFFILGLQAVRNVAWWALVAAPIAAHHLSLWAGQHTKSSMSARDPKAALIMTRAIAVLLVSLAASTLPWVKGLNPLVPEEKRGMVGLSEPQAAARFLQVNPVPALAHPVRYYSLQRWSGYLNWELWPRYQSMIDGPVEIYAAQVWRDYVHIERGGPDWAQRLDAYQVKLLVLDPSDQGDLVRLVDQSPGWAPILRDERAALYWRV